MFVSVTGYTGLMVLSSASSLFCLFSHVSPELQLLCCGLCPLCRLLPRTRRSLLPAACASLWFILKCLDILCLAHFRSGFWHSNGRFVGMSPVLRMLELLQISCFIWGAPCIFSLCNSSFSVPIFELFYSLSISLTTFFFLLFP